MRKELIVIAIGMVVSLTIVIMAVMWSGQTDDGSAWTPADDVPAGTVTLP